MTAFSNLFLFVWISLTREAAAVLTVDKRASFDSMPAMFGSPWVTDTQYQARLQALPARPFLCEDDETASFVTTKNWGRRLGQLDTNNITQQLERKLVQNELPIALLVSRGACSYKEKAREAMKLQNVDFVIVFDDQAKQPLVPMTSSDSSEGQNVHLLFVSYGTGLRTFHVTCFHYLSHTRYDRILTDTQIFAFGCADLQQLLRGESSDSRSKGGLLITMDGQIPTDADGSDNPNDADSNLSQLLWVFIGTWAGIYFLVAISGYEWCIRFNEWWWWRCCPCYREGYRLHEFIPSNDVRRFLDEDQLQGEAFKPEIPLTDDPTDDDLTTCSDTSELPCDDSTSDRMSLSRRRGPLV